MKTYKPQAGENIKVTADEMVKMATFGNEVVTAEFNGVALDASPSSTVATIVKVYSDEIERRHQEYLASPQHAKDKRERAEREERERRELAEALADVPAEPTWRDREAWDKSVSANKDGYGGAVMSFASNWARIMEARMKAGAKLEDCAEETSSIAARVEGLTGFQYGCAVSILSQCWIHGEQLRRWHNVKTQICDEGERANESGGVLNPALLSM